MMFGIGSDCGGCCKDCVSSVGCCLAGHGDDDFVPKENVKNKYKKNNRGKYVALIDPFLEAYKRAMDKTRELKKERKSLSKDK